MKAMRGHKRQRATNIETKSFLNSLFAASVPLDRLPEVCFPFAGQSLFSLQSNGKLQTLSSSHFCTTSNININIFLLHRQPKLEGQCNQKKKTHTSCKRTSRSYVCLPAPVLRKPHWSPTYAVRAVTHLWNFMSFKFSYGNERKLTSIFLYWTAARGPTRDKAARDPRSPSYESKQTWVACQCVLRNTYIVSGEPINITLLTEIAAFYVPTKRRPPPIRVFVYFA